MPDATGNFKSAFYALSDERYALIFGKQECEACGHEPDEFCSVEDCPQGS